MILPSPIPPEYVSADWCRDCQLGRHALCRSQSCTCESSMHPDLIPLTLRPKCIVGDAFWRATGGL